MRSSVEQGFAKALSSIMDGNLTTLLAAAFLFQFGTGPIRGFAVTLACGILASLFTAVFVSRWMFDTMLSTRARVEKLSIWRAVERAGFQEDSELILLVPSNPSPPFPLQGPGAPPPALMRTPAIGVVTRTGWSGLPSGGGRRPATGAVSRTGESGTVERSARSSPCSSYRYARPVHALPQAVGGGLDAAVPAWRDRRRLRPPERRHRFRWRHPGRGAASSSRLRSTSSATSSRSRG